MNGINVKVRVFKIRRITGIVYGVDWKDPITHKRKRMVIGVKKEAELVSAKIRNDIMEKGYFELQNQHEKTYSDAVKEYLEDVEKEKITYKSDEYTLRIFGVYKNSSTQNKQIKELVLSEIPRKAVEDFRNMRASIVAPATVNRELAVLKHFYNKCIGWEYAEVNPVKTVKMLKLPPQRERHLDENEIEELLKACREADPKASHLSPIVILLLNTGMRIGEALYLKRKDIDFKDNLIYISKSKNGECRYVPMNSEVRNVLSDLTGFHSKNKVQFIDDYLFRNEAGRRYKSIKRSFNNALKRAKIVDCTLHTLRHTFASHLAEKTDNLATVKEILGHKTLAMTLRYSHSNREKKLIAVEGLYQKKNGTYLARLDSKEDSEKTKVL